MFHDTAMLGAACAASPAPIRLYQPLSYSDPSLANATALVAPKGVWFDEGIDLRDPEGDALTQFALDAIQDIDTRSRRRRGVDEINHRMIVRKLLSNGFRAFYHRDPPFVACQRKAAAYKGKPQWLTGKAIARATNLLAKAGLIRVSLGEYGTATTYSVAQELRLVALRAGVTDGSLTYRLSPERLVRLYHSNSEDGQYVDYEPTADTCQWTVDLADYNAFIAQQDIELNLSDLDALRLTARMNGWQKRHVPRLTRPEMFQTDLYRQFNNASFEQGGRLYGGWWVNCPSDLRSLITINEETTVELDYSGCAIRMLYHERGMECPDDPYFLAPIADYEAKLSKRPGYYREAIKKLTQARINGSNRDKDMMCDLPQGVTFRHRYGRGEVMRMIEEKHSAIAEAFGSGAGIRLQRKDSDLALAIIKNLSDKGIATLPVHDSFIVSEDNEDELKSEMTAVYHQMTGFSPVIN